MPQFQMHNQFWRNRSEHGRDLLFNSSKKLKKACTNYFNYVDGKSWDKIEVNKSAIKTERLIKVPQAIPYTLSGLCLYLQTSSNWWKEFRKAKKATPDILAVIEWVEEVIETQNFTGAAVGAFNANIISRKLGLIDKINNMVTDGDGNPLANMSDEDLAAKIARINSKASDE